MGHPTTRPPTDDDAVRCARLATDLEKVDTVTSTTERPTYSIVRFEVDDSTAMPADVLRVLADHGASLTGICLETDPSHQEAQAYLRR